MWEIARLARVREPAASLLLVGNDRRYHLVCRVERQHAGMDAQLHLRVLQLRQREDIGVKDVDHLRLGLAFDVLALDFGALESSESRHLRPSRIASLKESSSSKVP